MSVRHNYLGLINVLSRVIRDLILPSVWFHIRLKDSSLSLSGRSILSGKILAAKIDEDARRFSRSLFKDARDWRERWETRGIKQAETASARVRIKYNLVARAIYKD